MSENVQVGNDADEAAGIEALQSGSSPESTNFDSGDFFEALDNEVNSGILDQPSEEQITPQVAQAQPVQQESPVEGEADVENLQKRYSDSSREAKRLNGKLTELEPYMPILDAMREDPNLIQHVRNYFQGGGQAPVSMKESLELDEDFVFDPDDAVSNPTSDSGKLLSATIDGVVQKRLNGALASQKQENQKLTRESEFKQKYEMNDNEWGEFVQFAKNKTLELEDIHYLMNRGSREQNIAKNANEQVSQQMKKTQQRPQSLATAGSHPHDDASPEDAIFNTILGVDTALEEAFG
tara:strand:- start:503 stop:1387 length:885 start_codon:yes stop_codon:yes gene_type:complete